VGFYLRSKSLRNVGERSGLQPEAVVGLLERVSDEAALGQGRVHRVEQRGLAQASVLAHDDSSHPGCVLDGGGPARWKMVGATDADPADEELQQLALGCWENGEDILEANLTEARTEPLSRRDPDGRVVDEALAVELGSRVEAVVVVEDLIGVVRPLHVLQAEHALGCELQVGVTTLGADERLPELADIRVHAGVNRLQALELLQRVDVLQRLEPRRVGHALDLGRLLGDEDAVVDVVAALGEFHVEVELAEELHTLGVELADHPLWRFLLVLLEG